MKKVFHESGFMSVVAMVAVAAIGVSTVYVKSEQDMLSGMIQSDKQQAKVEASTQAARNGLNRFRSLLSGRTTSGSQGNQPAVYASNYFAPRWQLVRNNGVSVTKFTTPNSSTVSLETDYAKSDLNLNQAVAIMRGGNMQNLSESWQTFRIIRTNSNTPGSKLVNSVDVEVTNTAQGTTTTQISRIRLDAPQPQALRLEISPRGAETWSTNFTNIASGPYDIRVIASGVVYSAEVSVNGNPLPKLGVADGEVIHQARNILSSNQEIGRFSFDFTSPRTCNPNPGDGIYQIVATLTKADGTPYTQAGISDGGLQVQVQPQALGTTYHGVGCYWMENITGNYCYIPSPYPAVNKKECKHWDSCSGGEGASAGGCYKWSDGSKGHAEKWDD